MRLKQIINENESLDHGKIIDTLIRTCMPYLRDIGYDKGFSHHLYSGRGRYKAFFEDRIRGDREPKDTPRWLHNEVDAIFQKKFGVRARSNAIFASGDLGFASSYGYPFIIFPKGHYTILWNDDVTDLFLSLKSIYRGAVEDYDSSGSWDIPTMIKKIPTEVMYDYIDDVAHKEWVKNYSPDTKGGVWTYSFEHFDPADFRKFGIKGRTRDIFIKGFSKEKVKDILHDRYGGVFPDSLIWSPDITFEDFRDRNHDRFEKEYIKIKTEQIESLIGFNITELINTYTKGDIKGAIDSNNEVMVMSSEGYCALNHTMVSVYDPIFHYFDDHGYHTISETIKKIGRDNWQEFKEISNFTSDL